jgi:SAP domain-containing new25
MNRVELVDALSPTMTLRDFENGYWYLEQLKNFAERIGIPAARKLRKDELEKAIVAFLGTGNVAAQEAIAGHAR